MHPLTLHVSFLRSRVRVSTLLNFAIASLVFGACVDSSPTAPKPTSSASKAVPAAGVLSRPVPIAKPFSNEAPVAGRISGAAPGPNLLAGVSSSVSAAAAASAMRILWQNTTTGDRSIWIMNGTSYSSAVLLPNVPTQWSIAGSGDFNGDGSADIVWQNLTTGDRSIWFMNGNSYASAALLPNVPTQWSIAGVGDFNGDGKPDIVWQNLVTGDRSIWFMNGSTYASAALLPNVSTAWNIVAVGDFNGDGKPDLVWQRPGTGETSIWFMNGSTYSSAALLPTVPSAWRIAGAADFDGDGNPDLVWQNVNTGERSIWLMNGSSYASAALLPTVPNQWSIAGVLQPGIKLVANAGADQDRNKGESTTLDGSSSVAPAGAVYTWTQVSGPDVTGGTGTLSGISPTFTAPSSVSTLEFDLTIQASGATSATDRVVTFVFEDKTNPIFVSLTGNDASAGTRAAPMRTISAAIMRAATAVYVMGTGVGAYDESVFLRSDISLYGGYSSTWIRSASASVTRIRPTTGIPLSGLTPTNLTVDGFYIEAADALTPGTSSYAIVLPMPAGVIISNNTIKAGRGADGAVGPPGTSSAAGSDGSPGGQGSYPGISAGSGGSPGNGAPYLFVPGTGGASGGGGWTWRRRHRWEWWSCGGTRDDRHQRRRRIICWNIALRSGRPFLRVYYEPI